MAAIQDIQNLIARAQPIPLDLQRAALLEAQSLGMNNQALADAFGVPVSMVSDAAAATGVGSVAGPLIGGFQEPGIPAVMRPLPIAPFPPAQPTLTVAPAPAANPLAGIPVDNNYTQAEIDTVKNLVNSGQVDVNQVAQNFNVTPNYVAAALELPMDNMSIQAISNEQAREQIKSIPVNPADGYTDEQVETVTNLLNKGQVNVADVADHFKVDENLVIEIISEIPKSVYEEGSFTPEQTKKLEGLITTGVATAPQVAKYFDAPVSEVSDYLEQNTGLTRDQIVDSMVSNVVADKDYNMQDAQRVGEQISQGNITAEEAADQFGVTIDGISKLMSEMGLTVPAQGATPTAGQTAAQTTQTAAQIAQATAPTSQAQTGQQLSSVPQYNDPGFTSVMPGATATAGAPMSSSIPTGLSGSEQALRTGASGAIEMLDQLNTAGRADLSNQYARGLEQAAAQSQIARGDITSGTTQGLNAIGTGFGQARQDIGGAYGRAEGMFNPYMQAGNTALQQQMALSGALGQDAFNQAYQESPQMAFLREQGMRANLSGAAATGGLGGGNVQKELQRFGQGLASQGLQQQISNLGALSSQGLGATGSAAGIATGAGTNLANLATGEAQARSNALMSQGSNLANIATGLGSQQLQAQTNLGGQLAGNLAQYGLPAVQSISNLGTNLAAGRTRAGELLAQQYGQTAGALGGIYSNQGRDIASMTDSQRQMLMNMVQSGALTEAQAQQAYSTNMANLQSGIGGQLAGVPNAPIFSPDYGQQIGQAFQAGGIGAYLGGQQQNTPAPVSTSVGVVPNQGNMYVPNLGIPANQFNFDR